jgi:DNA uptake protein ComE-like DNA-binding protein
VKAGAKQAAAEAKVAAANAERQVNDIAVGVKEGLHSNTPASAADSGAVDINAASELRLAMLPGVSLAQAREIVNNRPYATPHSLVSKGVLTRSEYARISGEIVAHRD